MSEESDKRFPRVPCGFSDLQGIERIVWASILYFQKAPVSAKNTRRIHTLQQIHGRLRTQLPSATQEVQMVLNMEELEELLEAMLAFASLMKRMFPQNEQRDSVIAAVNAWRQRLISIIAEFEA